MIIILPNGDAVRSEAIDMATLVGPAMSYRDGVSLMLRSGQGKFVLAESAEAATRMRDCIIELMADEKTPPTARHRLVE